MIYQPLNTRGVDYSAGIIKNFSSYPLHRHVAIEMMYVMEGELSVLIDGKATRQSPGISSLSAVDFHIRSLRAVSAPSFF